MSPQDDIDTTETAEWLDALNAVVVHRCAARCAAAALPGGHPPVTGAPGRSPRRQRRRPASR